MATKVGINGFGRVGRQVLKAIQDNHRDALEVVALNTNADTKTCAHLFKYDSNYGTYPGSVEYTEDAIIVDGMKIKKFAQKEIASIPWGEVGADLIIESTGKFNDATKVQGHFANGGKKVIFTAPAKNEDITIVMGVNDEKYDPKSHNTISNASCTTNGLAPVAKVLVENFGVVRGLMTTVHAYTNDQQILDKSHKDLRRARAAAMSIIPTSTGAAKAAALVIPELKGKFHGLALRVPTSTVSIIDLVVETEKPTTVEAINAAMRKAAEGRMKGILHVADVPLVSIDYKGTNYSAILDADLTMAMGDNLFKLMIWYDNEWGYSVRVADLAAMVAKTSL